MYMENDDIPKKKKIWHAQQEKILKRWSEIGASYRYLHDRAYAYYNKQNFRFALPVIVLSTITGTANFALKSFPEAWRETVPLVIGFLNLSAGLITTVSQFLRVSELLEGHRAASIAYSKLSRNISVELSLPVKERTSNGTDFINGCRTELDRLIEQSPSIPYGIITEFGSRFKDAAFIKPDILEIRSVEIYKDDGDDDKRELEKLMEQQRFREKILEDEKNRRLSLLKDIQEEKKIHEEQLKKKMVVKKAEKKKNVNMGNVQKKMQDLIHKLQVADRSGAVITPSSSEAEDSDESDGDDNNGNDGVVDGVVDGVGDIEIGGFGIGVDNNENNIVIDISDNSV